MVIVADSLEENTFFFPSIFLTDKNNILIPGLEVPSMCLVCRGLTRGNQSNGKMIFLKYVTMSGTDLRMSKPSS